MSYAAAAALLREIIVQGDPTYWSEQSQRSWCHYCAGYEGTEHEQLRPHAPDCAWVRAEAWVKEKDAKG